MSEMVRIISDKLVQENITVEEVITQVENTWRWFGEGKVIMPSKITLDMSSLDVHGWFNSMPSYIQDTDLAGLKFVGGFIDNKAIGLPFIRAKLLLFDPRTGSMKALMGGDWISQFRTGAQPAIACKCLAASTDVVTIIGAGAQSLIRGWKHDRSPVTIIGAVLGIILGLMIAFNNAATTWVTIAEGLGLLYTAITGYLGERQQ